MVNVTIAFFSCPSLHDKQAGLLLLVFVGFTTGDFQNFKLTKFDKKMYKRIMKIFL